MDDTDMVMRSVYLWPSQDSELRQLAHDLNVTKSDLIRSAIGLKLEEWLKANDRDRVMQDVEVGRRETNAERVRSRSGIPPAEAKKKNAGEARSDTSANQYSKPGRQAPKQAEVKSAAGT